MNPRSFFRSEAAQTIALGFVAFLVCVVRVPWSLHDVAWAEDANVFLHEALLADPWTIIGSGYAGYLHVVPRFLAAVIMTLVPAAGYAVAVFFACAALAGLVAAAVFHLAHAAVPWLPARAAIALLPVLLPLSAQEVLGNLANLHTLALWLAFWVLFAARPTRRAAVGWSVVVLLCAVTEIQTAVLLVLAPFLVRRRDPRSWLPFAALALGAAWQAATLVTTPRESADHSLALLSYPYGWLINTVLPMVNADPGSAGRWLDGTGLLVPIIALAPFVVSFAVVLTGGRPRQRLLVSAAVILSVLLYVASAWVNASAGLDYAAGDAPLSALYLHMRYGVSSGLFLAVTVPLAAVVLRERRSARPALLRGVSIAAVTALVVVFAVSGTRSFPARSLVDGTWSAGARQADSICATAAAAAPAAADQQVVLPVAPARVLILDCGAWTSYPTR